MMNWVTIKKLSDMTGYTQDAIRAKIKKGHWLKGIHWRKAPDNRNLMNVKAIERWIEGKTV
jgi:hypothetical protein